MFTRLAEEVLSCHDPLYGERKRGWHVPSRAWRDQRTETARKNKLEAARRESEAENGMGAYIRASCLLQ
jgi:hypothetical protein